jgi:methyl-accepting chemotaxis protein
MTIKLKLLLIAAGIAVAMILSIASMRWSMNHLDDLTQAQALNLQLNGNMLMLRRNEKDFLMRNDMKYLEKFNKNFAIIKNNLTQLHVLLKDNDINISDFEQMENILNQYRDLFHQLVETTQTIGLNPKSGLRGTLRGSVHKTETIFKEVSNDTLLANMLMLRRNEKDFLMRLDKKYLKKFDNNFMIFVDNIKSSSIEEGRKAQLLKDAESYKSDFLKLAELAEKKGFDAKSGILGQMRSTIHQSEDIITKSSKTIEATITDSMKSIERVNLIVALMIAAIIIVFTYLVGRSINRPLESFIKTMKEISATGNLTQRVDDNGNDEIAEVGKTLNALLSEFQNIVQRLHVASADLTQYARQFMSIREETFDSVEKQQIETHEVSHAMTEMSSAAKHISSNTIKTADAAEQANDVTNDGKAIVDQSISSTRNLETIINNASVVIQQLGDDSNSIGSILDVIRGIAEQTNLLALNAAIEAARAGEQGRGFAVVADEVRTLAQKTQDSISEIEAMITSLQNGSHKAIDAINQGKEGVSKNVEQIASAGDSLSNIVLELNDINRMSQENAAATEEQSAVAEEVNNNVVMIKELGSQIVDKIELLKEYSDKMGALSASMEELVKRFEV